MRGLFEEQFVERLRAERCRRPRVPAMLTISIPLGVLWAAYWSRGALDALVVGVGFLLPAVVLYSVYYLGELHRHDVTMQEAIKFVEHCAALSKREATRRLHLPEIFSRREMRTGEADAE
jgi:hypothetical protein